MQRDDMQGKTVTLLFKASSVRSKGLIEAFRCKY